MTVIALYFVFFLLFFFLFDFLFFFLPVLACSSGNLSGDLYLSQQMDDQGWVPLALIAGFNKVNLIEDRKSPLSCDCSG